MSLHPDQWAQEKVGRLLDSPELRKLMAELLGEPVKGLPKVRPDECPDRTRTWAWIANVSVSDNLRDCGTIRRVLFIRAESEAQALEKALAWWDSYRVGTHVKGNDFVWSKPYRQDIHEAVDYTERGELTAKLNALGSDQIRGLLGRYCPACGCRRGQEEWRTNCAYCRFDFCLLERDK